MLVKILGALLLTAGVILGVGVLLALIGAALGLLWVCIKLAVPLVLVYCGYRLLAAGRARRASWA